MHSITQDRTKITEYAKKYYDLGLSIIPINTEKTPLVEWKKYQKERPRPSDIATWFNSSFFTSAGIGIVTGEISGVVVVDFDGDEGLVMMKKLEIGKTPIAKTGKGYHVYYKHPGFTCRNFARKRPGMDFRGDGGYAVAPPSAHPSGKYYEWIKAPWDVEFAPCPDWLIEMLNERPKGIAGGNQDEIIPEGQRNAVLTSLAGSMRRRGMTPEAIAAALKVENQNRCYPPLPDREVEEIAKSIGRYEPEVEAQGEDGKETQAQKLIALARGAELWKTPTDEFFATFEVNGHKEHWPIKRGGFRRWLARKFYELEGKPPSAQAMQDTLNMLEAFAQFDGEEYEVYTRLAVKDDVIYLDLVNEDWEAVEITKNGWQVIKNAPVKFCRGHGSRPLPYPVKGGSIEELRRFVNVPDDDAWRLLVAYILGAFIPAGGYPVLVLYGEQGSAKTVTTKVIKELIDPSKPLIRSMPKEDMDLIIAAQGSLLLAFDNVNNLPPWLSDAICRLSTGAGFGTRKLYTNDEEAVFDAKRPSVLNGITDIVSRHDLIDRMIILTLQPIPENMKKKEDIFWEEFNEAKPRILGALLDVVATGLANKDKVSLTCLPRMADFAFWVVACEPALPWKSGEFMKSYRANRKEAIEAAIENNELSAAVMEFAKREGEWIGTARELLDKLSFLVGEKVSNQKGWPKAANDLTRRLNLAANFLRSSGVEIEHGGREAKRRCIRITYIGTDDDEPSMATASEPWRKW